MKEADSSSSMPKPEKSSLKTYSNLTKISYSLAPALIVFSHIGCLLLLYTGVTIGSLFWALGLYLARAIATTAIYHRLLTHRSYRAPRFVLWSGCLIAASAAQLGPSCWKAHHLAHHSHTDCEGDPHSPAFGGVGLKSFLWSQFGWVLSPALFPERLPADVESDPVLRLIDRLHFVPVLILGALSHWYGGLQYLGAFFLATTLHYHTTAFVNSLSHLFGDRPFATSDYSRNNAFVALLTLGEGWHNLHHAFPVSCRHGFTLRNGEVRRLPDPTFTFIRFLSWLGLASGLRVPSDSMLLAQASPIQAERMTPNLPEAAIHSS